MPMIAHDRAIQPLGRRAHMRARHRTAACTTTTVGTAVRVRLVACVACVAMLALALIPGMRPFSVAATAAAPPIILVFTRTTGYRHASIPAAVAAVRALGRRDGFAVVATADPRAFTDAVLHRFRAVAFLLTTGTVLNAGQRGALERFVRHGGGLWWTQKSRQQNEGV